MRALKLGSGVTVMRQSFFGGRTNLMQHILVDKMKLISNILSTLLALSLSASFAFAEEGAAAPREANGHRVAEKPAANNGAHEAARATARPSTAGRDVRREGGQPRHQFQARDVRRFHRDELALWRGGRWNNTCYGGRCGWWWFAAGQWYFYDRPMYPYPLAVAEVVYIEPMVALPLAPPPQVTYLPAPVTPPMPVQPAPKFFYYCDSPAGFFPAVQTCSTQFRQVAAPVGQVAPAPAAVAPPQGQ